jgi:hypothetical protein
MSSHFSVVVLPFADTNQTQTMGTVSRPGGMRPKWHKKRLKRLKLRRRKLRARAK